MNCPSCGGEPSPIHRFCPSCGAPISSLSQAPTAALESPAAAVFIAWLPIMNAMRSIPGAISLALLLVAVFIVFLRFGLLSLIAFSFFMVVSENFQSAAWDSAIGLTGLALMLALTHYAFHTSLGGQPLFGRASLED